MEIDLEIKSRLYEAAAISISKWESKRGLFSSLFGYDVKKLMIDIPKLSKIEVERWSFWKKIERD